MQGFEKVLIIGKVWPEPKSSTAGTRMMQLIHLFLEQNYKITFACAAKKTEFQEDFAQFPIDLVEGVGAFVDGFFLLAEEYHMMRLPVAFSVSLLIF